MDSWLVSSEYPLALPAAVRNGQSVKLSVTLVNVSLLPTSHNRQSCAAFVKHAGRKGASWELNSVAALLVVCIKWLQSEENLNFG